MVYIIRAQNDEGVFVKLAIKEKRKFNYVMLGGLALIVAIGIARYLGL